jgi:hypothetical protein
MVDFKELAQQGYSISSEYLVNFDSVTATEEYIARLKRMAYQPGDQVRLRQDQISVWIAQSAVKPQMAEYQGVLKSLQNVGENKLEVDHVHVDNVGDVIYSFIGSDLKIEASFCTNALPFIHEYGVLALHEDRVWFVHINDQNSDVMRVFEITQEPGRAAKHQIDVDSFSGLVQLLKNEESQAIAGEFAVEDHGAETWGLLYTPWQSSAPVAELEKAILAIQEIVKNDFKPH